MAGSICAKVSRLFAFLSCGSTKSWHKLFASRHIYIRRNSLRESVVDHRWGLRTQSSHQVRKTAHNRTQNQDLAARTLLKGGRRCLRPLVGINLHCGGILARLYCRLNGGCRDFQITAQNQAAVIAMFCAGAVFICASGVSLIPDLGPFHDSFRLAGSPQPSIVAGREYYVCSQITVYKNSPELCS